MHNDQRHQQIKRVTWMGIGVNISLALAQLVGGILAHSQALIADGLHTLADLFSDFVVLLTAGHAAKEADADHPYGHGRLETLSTIFLGVLLIAVALGIGFEGVNNISNPQSLPLEPFALFFALLAIGSKEFLYRYTLRISVKVNSSLLKSNAVHHRSDALSSLVVLVGVGAQLYGIQHMDALAALIVAVFIAGMGLRLVQQAFAELIDTSLDQQLIEQIRQHILAINGITEIHSLRSRSMGGQGLIDTEIRVNPHLSVSEAHHISLMLERSIKKQFPKISDVTIHIDPVSDQEHQSIVELPGRAEMLFNLYSAWEGIDHADRIENIQLHYLGSEIDIDIILPLEFAQENPGELARSLYDAASSLAYVGKINIYYAQ